MFDITQDTGVKRASALCVHRHFDLCKGVVVDVMHYVFLEVISEVLARCQIPSCSLQHKEQG